MKALIILSALTLGACQPALQAVVNSTSICQVGSGTLIDEKTLYAAEALYNVPAHAYVTADRNGHITPALRTQIRPKLITMYQLLKSMRAAKGTVNCDIDAMKELHREVLALIPNRG